MLSINRPSFHIVILFPVYISVFLFLWSVLIPQFPELQPKVFNKLPSLLQLAKLNQRTAYFKRLLPRTFSTSSESSTLTMNAMQFIPRRSEERGHADHDWLKTFHTFSFSTYQDRRHELFGSLRVINEDRVAPRTGFGTHSHREFEIFSYVVSGELEHKDSMGNTEILKRGDLQLTSAGTGISHSEKAHGSKQVHFLQIWSLPSVSRLPPKYFTRHFSDAQKADAWAKVVAPIGDKDVKVEREAEGPAPVQSPLTLYATILSPGMRLDRTMEGKKGYIHLIQNSGYNAGPAKGASVKVTSRGGEDLVLREGDGAYILVGNKGNFLSVENTGEVKAEILVFDLD